MADGSLVSVMMVDGQWSMVDGRWSMVDGRLTMVSGRCYMAQISQLKNWNTFLHSILAFKSL